MARRSHVSSRHPLVVESLTKRYREVTALADVDLQIAEGEILALLGANGAGKTTLLSIVAGLRRPDAGRVWVNGTDIHVRPSEARRALGLAPQETGVYPTLRVRDNLHFFGELGGLRRAPLRRRISEIGEAFALSHLLTRTVRTLSGGEARRLHTAMIFMYRPALLLLDEPTAGVDIRNRALLLDVIRALAAEGSSVCYSTHYLPEVEQLNASVAIIDHGRIIASGSAAELVRTYGHAAVELHFADRAPTLKRAGTLQVSGTVLRIVTNLPPAIEAAEILSELGADAQRLRAVELIRPSLENVFLELTGRHTAIEG
jgi:ABC-2 type transport system ATP-binding protein